MQSGGDRQIALYICYWQYKYLSKVELTGHCTRREWHLEQIFMEIHPIGGALFYRQPKNNVRVCVWARVCFLKRAWETNVSIKCFSSYSCCIRDRMVNTENRNGPVCYFDFTQYSRNGFTALTFFFSTFLVCCWHELLQGNLVYSIVRGSHCWCLHVRSLFAADHFTPLNQVPFVWLLI